MVGTKINQYEILEKIGEGGMGEVYLALDTKLDRKAALKFLPVHYNSDPEFKSRFEHEAKAAASLAHPNIITVHELGEHEGRLFIAMQYVAGSTLEDLISSDSLKTNSALNIVMQVCEGLSAAHEAGIVHRDIKPANILVTSRGRVYILDFGLAKSRKATTETKVGSTVGTVHYESPEQSRGEQVDSRSDLFSVGVVLFEMLTGKRPFTGEYSESVRYSITHEEAPPLARYTNEATEQLQRIVDKALSKDKSLRYQSANDLLADIKRIGLYQAHPLKSRRSAYIATGAALIVIVLLFVLNPWEISFRSTQDAVAQEDRLAIMYFDNLADARDSVKMGEIAANLLITDLSESEYVNVVSSQRLYDILRSLGHEGQKNISRSLATEVANAARSKRMLLGSILQITPRIIVTSQLVDVNTGSAVTSQRVDGNIGEDIFSIVDRLTIEVKKDLSLPTEALTENDIPVSDYTQSAEAYRYYLEGFELIFKYDYISAADKFHKALELDSTFTMAYFGLSWSGVDAEKQLQMITIAAQNTDRVNYLDKHSILARKAQLEDNYTNAIRELELILKKDPGNTDTWNWMGSLYKYIDIDKALECFRKVIDLDSTHKLTYNELAYLYDRLGDPDSSIWAINKYIELAPDEPNPYDSRGHLYALNGKLDDAIASYEKALAIDADFEATQMKLANIYMFNQQYDKARALYRILTSHSDKHQRAYGRQLLARIPMHQGKYQEALRTLEAGIQTDIMELGESLPVANKLWVRSVILGQYLNRNDDALVDLDRAVNILKSHNPQESFINHFMAFIARCHAAKGDFESAEQTIEAIRQNNKKFSIQDSSNVNLARALVAMEKGQFASFSEIWKLPKGTRFFAGEYYFAMNDFLAGRVGESVERLESTINTYDSNRAGWPGLSVRMHYWLGRAYEASGWNEKAIDQYEIFLDIWKNADSGLVELEDAKSRYAFLAKSN